MAPPKWTIALVNWNSTEFINYHAKFFHSFAHDFELLICDNTKPYQQELQEIANEYKKTRIILPQGNDLSHGAGINTCLAKAKGKYILINDPDFFWMRKQILEILESYFEQGYHAIGTEFWEHPFPMPWGAAYITNEIRDLDCRSKVASFCNTCQEKVYDKWSDTGWQIRIRLQNKPHFAFRKVKQRDCVPFLGNHSYAFKPISFVYSGEFIAHHLLRGEYKDVDFVNDEMIEARKKYVEYFWKNLH